MVPSRSRGIDGDACHAEACCRASVLRRRIAKAGEASSVFAFHDELGKDQSRLADNVRSAQRGRSADPASCLSDFSPARGDFRLACNLLCRERNPILAT